MSQRHRVRDWLAAPLTTRGPMGPGSVTDCGTAGQQFDAIMHNQQVTPADQPSARDVVGVLAIWRAAQGAVER